MTTFARYALYHLPSVVLSALLLYWLWPKTGLAPWLGVLAWCVWVVKDLLLYPWVRSAYEHRTATGAERLVGETGVAGTTLAPNGQVRVRGELWRARAADGTEVPAGAVVRIERAEGLTLFVRAAEGGHPRGR